MPIAPTRGLVNRTHRGKGADSHTEIEVDTALHQIRADAYQISPRFLYQNANYICRTLYNPLQVSPSTKNFLLCHLPILRLPRQHPDISLNKLSAPV